MFRRHMIPKRCRFALIVTFCLSKRPRYLYGTVIVFLKNGLRRMLLIKRTQSNKDKSWHLVFLNTHLFHAPFSYRGRQAISYSDGSIVLRFNKAGIQIK